MTSLRCSPPLPLLLALALAGACDSGTKDAPATKAAAKAATPDKGADAKKDAPPVKAHGAGPHGAPGPAAGPHGGMPPMMGAAPKAPAGPPRDVTPSGETAAETLAELGFAVPKEWEKGTPANRMRLAQWVLPGPGGDAELVVFRFPGGAGGIEANLTRWKGQFTPPEGKTIDDVSTTTTVEGAGGLKTTLVDVSGTYVAAMSPGSSDKHDDADSRMLAAIVQGSGDAFYFKAVGPKATMDIWAASYNALIASYSVTADDGAAPGGAGGLPGMTPPPGAGPAQAGDAKADPDKAGG